MAKLVSNSSPTDQAWNKLIPTCIRPAAGKLRLAPFMALMRHHNMGGSIWLQLFLFGFKLTGTLSQRFTFPTSEKAIRKPLIPLSKIASSTSSRFSDRASRSGFKNAQLLWDEAMGKTSKGWHTQAFPLSTTKAPFTLLDPQLNIAFRFGVQQPNKLRACDDLRYAMTNLACSVVAPIKLASWDHLAEMCRSIIPSQCDWHFFKADHEAAYKKLPIDWGESSLAVIALRNPADGRGYGFMSRTHMFGAISEVLHYNIFSRVVAELVCRTFGIPMLSYFDDFGALLPASLASRGLRVFSRWRELLGISLKLAKSEVGPRITFLGLLGSSPSVAGGMKLQVALTEEKASRWTASISNYLKEGVISSNELEKLIGKLCFSHTCLFGKFARTQLRCLYRKLYAPKYIAHLASHERLTLRWWIDVLSNLSPRVPRGSSHPPDFVLYTDAATSANRIAALLFKGSTKPPLVITLAVSRVPNFRRKRFNSKDTIFGLEMLAPLAFLWMNRKQRAGSSINLYIDNNNVLTALVRGDSGTDLIAAMIAMFWRIAEAYSIDIWLGRVASKRNPADLPTREAPITFKVEKRVEFSQLFQLLQLTMKWEARIC